MPSTSSNPGTVIGIARRPCSAPTRRCRRPTLHWIGSPTSWSGIRRPRAGWEICAVDEERRPVGAATGALRVDPVSAGRRQPGWRRPAISLDDLAPDSGVECWHLVTTSAWRQDVPGPHHCCARPSRSLRSGSNFLLGPTDTAHPRSGSGWKSPLVPARRCGKPDDDVVAFVRWTCHVMVVVRHQGSLRVSGAGEGARRGSGDAPPLPWRRRRNAPRQTPEGDGRRSVYPILWVSLTGTARHRTQGAMLVPVSTCEKAWSTRRLAWGSRLRRGQKSCGCAISIFRTECRGPTSSGHPSARALNSFARAGRHYVACM